MAVSVRNLDSYYLKQTSDVFASTIARINFPKFYRDTMAHYRATVDICETRLAPGGFRTSRWHTSRRRKESLLALGRR